MMKELTITVKDFVDLFADADKMVTLCEVENGKATGRKAVCKIVSASMGIPKGEIASVTAEDAGTIDKAVDHPSYYGGADNTYEAIKVIDAWGLGFCLGNAVKYICRAGNKLGNSKLQDLKKAVWYCQHEIEKIEKEKAARTNVR